MTSINTLFSIKDLVDAGFNEEQARAIVDAIYVAPVDTHDIFKNLVEVGLTELQSETIANVIFTAYKTKKKKT